MNRILTMLLIPFFMLGTTAAPESVPPDYLITEITVTCPEDFPASRQFSDTQSIKIILQYLRGTGLSEEADTGSMDESAPLYTLTLTHITGRQTVYRQKGAEYLSKGGSPWYRIDPARGKLLLTLYRS